MRTSYLIRSLAMITGLLFIGVTAQAATTLTSVKTDKPVLLSGTADKLAHLGVFFLHGHPPSDALAHAREFMRTPAGVASPSGPTPLTNGALLFTPGMYAGSLTPPAPGHQATTDEALDVLYHRGATTTYHAELYIFRRRDQPLRAVTGGGHAGGVIAILDSSRHVYGATLAAASRALSAPSN